MAMTPRTAAVHALFRAAGDCPSRINTDAFADYQASVLEPLREALRKAVQSEQDVTE